MHNLAIAAVFCCMLLMPCIVAMNQTDDAEEAANGDA